MNILVIGNGFDLAHGLPTKYEHFLEFSKRVKRVYESKIDGSVPDYEKNYITDLKINDELKEMLSRVYRSRKYVDDASDRSMVMDDSSEMRELYNLVKDNLWMEYFFKFDTSSNESWIDFENEICEIIKSVDNAMLGLTERHKFDDAAEHITNKFINGYIKEEARKNRSITYRNIRDRLQLDLERLIRALEVYLDAFVTQIECQEISPDIQEILFPKKDEKVNKIVHRVLSFNYTNTFNRVYLRGQQVNGFVEYIHGKADINNSIETNNMVLGFNEYLSKKRRNKDVEFIAFKKFYQRVHKQTGCEYKEWIDIIKQDYINNEKEFERIKSFPFKEYIEARKQMNHYLYIFGHSLDITDKDVLKDLILNDNVYTTIYYHNKEAYGRMIANLVKVIGQNELIRRTAGRTKTIEFKPQKKMDIIEKQ